MLDGVDGDREAPNDGVQGLDQWSGGALSSNLELYARQSRQRQSEELG